MARSGIRGEQIKDDSLTGDDIDESTLILNTIKDADGDTKVQVEESADEDKIRFDVAGAEKVVLDATGLGVGTASPSTTLHAYADASNAYVALIDNDAGSSGHGLKVTTDGTGAGTYIFDLESSSTTLFRVRGDGRVGIGKVSSLPSAVLTVSSSNTDSDLAIAHKIHHIGDSDTYIAFEDDTIELVAGSRGFIKLEEASQDKLIINHGALDIDLKIGGENNANLIRTEAAIDSVYFGGGSAAGVDNNFWVSGSIGSKGTAARGTAVFGGDTVISGALHVKGGHTFQGSTTAAIILDSATASKIVWDSEDDGNSPDASVYESGGSLYLSGAADVRIYAATDDVLVFPKDQLQVLEHADASGNFATFYAQPSVDSYNSVLSIADTGVTVNDSGQTAHDFRVESNNNTHMIFVDSGNDKIGINKNSPTSTLYINGSLALNVRKIDAVNDPGTTFTIPDTDCVILVNTRPTAQNGIDSAITLTLPDASDNPGMVLTIKDSAGYSDVNAITISAAAGDNIDGNPSVTSINLPTPASFKKLISDGTNSWYEIGS